MAPIRSRLEAKSGPTDLRRKGMYAAVAAARVPGGARWYGDLWYTQFYEAPSGRRQGER